MTHIEPLVTFSVDLLLISRVFGAFAWGTLWAIALQQARWGRFLAEERTWLTVVVGVGVDLLIAYGGDWWTVAAVIAASSPAIIYRSLHNEATHTTLLGRNRMIAVLEDAIAYTNEQIKALDVLIERHPEHAPLLSAMLRRQHRIRELLVGARNGHMPVLSNLGGMQ